MTNIKSGVWMEMVTSFRTKVVRKENVWLSNETAQGSRNERDHLICAHVEPAPFPLLNPENPK